MEKRAKVHKWEGGPYYDLFFKYNFITFCLPFILAIILFYGWYVRKFWQFPPRLRTKRLVKAQVQYLKVIGLLLIFGSSLIVLSYGKFDNEFIRASILISCGLFSFYSHIHCVLRLIVSKGILKSNKIFSGNFHILCLILSYIYVFNF